jgi:hypothetical protein
MATVTFTADMPDGLRLQDLFTEIVRDIVPGTSDGNDTATFKVLYFEDEVEVFYSGTELSDAGGSVSYLRFGPANAPWLTIGVPGGPQLFTYTDLRDFHRGGAIAAAIVLSDADNLIGSAKGDFMESYAGNDLLDGGSGADTLHGGSGNDTYIVDKSAAATTSSRRTLILRWRKIPKSRFSERAQAHGRCRSSAITSQIRSPAHQATICSTEKRESIR